MKISTTMIGFLIDKIDHLFEGFPYLYIFSSPLNFINII